MKNITMNEFFNLSSNSFGGVRVSKSRKGDGLFLSITPEGGDINAFKALGGVILPKGGVILPNTTLEEWKNFNRDVEKERRKRTKNVKAMVEHLHSVIPWCAKTWFHKRYEYSFLGVRGYPLTNHLVEEFVGDYYKFFDWVDECMDSELIKNILSRLDEYKEKGLDIKVDMEENLEGVVTVEGDCSIFVFPRLLTLFREPSPFYEGVDLEKYFQILDNMVFIKENREEIDSLVKLCQEKLGREEDLPFEPRRYLSWNKTKSNDKFRQQDFSDWDVSFSGSWNDVLTSVQKEDVLHLNGTKENLELIKKFVDSL